MALDVTPLGFIHDGSAFVVHEEGRSATQRPYVGDSNPPVPSPTLGGGLGGTLANMSSAEPGTGSTRPQQPNFIQPPMDSPMVAGVGLPGVLVGMAYNTQLDATPNVGMAPAHWFPGTNYDSTPNRMSHGGASGGSQDKAFLPPPTFAQPRTAYWVVPNKFQSPGAGKATVPSVFTPRSLG